MSYEQTNSQLIIFFQDTDVSVKSFIIVKKEEICCQDHVVRLWLILGIKISWLYKSIACLYS